MKPAYLPHVLIILFAVTVVVTFIVGIFHPPAQATALMGTPQPSTSLQFSPATQISITTDTPNAVLIQQSHATDGITALGIIIVAVVVFGVLWGTHQQRKQQLQK